MNTPIFTNARLCSNVAVGLAIVFGFQAAHAEWTIDLSRRTRAARQAELNAPARTGDRSPASYSTYAGDGGDTGTANSQEPTLNVQSKQTTDIVTDDKEEKKGIFDTLFDSGEPVQDLVILQTDHGFVPSTVRVRKNGRYRMHVVNVNEKEKNVSFILDGFSEHHATFYGKIKTFMLEPKKEGSFSFQSPETASEGKLIVFNPQISMRAPASASGDGK